MAQGTQKIDLVKKGGVSLMDAEYANQLIRAINALTGLTIAPIANVGKTSYAGGSFILDLSMLDARVRQLEQLTGLSNGNFTAMNARLTNTIAAIRNVSANAACNANSNAITFTLTFPNVPNV